MKKFPLVFIDESNDYYRSLKKEYFSYISTALPAKGFSEYVDFVKWVSKRDKTIKFQIVTKTNIENHIDNELENLVSNERMIIKHGMSHLDSVMNEAYAKSNCTWFAYNSATQSGVLCRSFMFGAPGISTRLDAFNNCIDGKNGLAIDDNKNYKDIYEAYLKIQSDLENCSNSARRYFCEYFDYRNYTELMKEILECCVNDHQINRMD